MRLDALLIWGHGLPELDGILDQVRADPGFRIRRIVQREIDDLPRFVRSVYNFDYAPYKHLIDKTRYLMQTPARFAVIFADNIEPEEHESGSGRFKHIECRKMTALKRKIRERYNPTDNGKPTEHHIVHGTDHAGQTQAILELLGYRRFADLDHAAQGIIKTPGHLPPKPQWTLKQIPLQSVYARIVRKRAEAGDDGEAASPHMLLPLSQTPQALLLGGEPQAYEDYWQAHRGTLLQDDHAPPAFQALAERLDYLGEQYPDDYLLLEPLDEKRYVLLDGVHRAAILRSRGLPSFIGAVAA